ncbi:hypothetical protein [Actinomycetospora straminea]|uniref:Uncharacterized protein n=1 Tax=Actinomycetospora straminea TaxID=663607 RepID=A0ABP9EGQ2_9PSEU|nr:hypothetical protein [Actinomycetospora straminea]MDD7933728.1 hypothetical protein [Actinomycetospora straminea]
MPTAAFPFVEVQIDTSGLQPTAQRAPGVLAVVGESAAGSAAANVPLRIDTAAQAAELFASVDADGVVTPSPLYRSLNTALLQDPRPSTIYGVKVDAGQYGAGLAALEAADDVTFVCLAEVTDVGTPAAENPPAPPTDLHALKAHCEQMSAAGQKRIGVAMIDPTTAKTPTYVQAVVGAVDSLRSDTSRMIMIAARGGTGDAAVASAAAIAGLEPHISTVLKRVRGVTMPVESQYAPGEIIGLSDANIIPIIDPALVVGESLHLAEGRCFTTDASLLYVDIVRVLDDIDFRLKAGLIGLVGSARITLAGLSRVVTRAAGILGPLVRSSVIADYTVTIPVLAILRIPESSWTPSDAAIVATARANREVDMFVTVTYGPAVHRLKVTLSPRF